MAVTTVKVWGRMVMLVGAWGFCWCEVFDRSNTCTSPDFLSVCSVCFGRPRVVPFQVRERDLSQRLSAADSLRASLERQLASAQRTVEGLRLKTGDFSSSSGGGGGRASGAGGGLGGGLVEEELAGERKLRAKLEGEVAELTAALAEGHKSLQSSAA